MGLADLPRFISGGTPNIAFEDSKVGRMKKEVFEATDAEVDEMLKEFGFPCSQEFGKPGVYIQTTVGKDQEEIRKNNDVVLIPVGCTENHGPHNVSAMDTLFCTCICEGVRRYTVKQGRPVSIAMPPLMYGTHPQHHIGMPGTVIVHEETTVNMLVDVMLGLWNSGYRKQIIINNHGQFWALEAALQRFCKDYQLPGIFRLIDWHKAVKELFTTKTDGGDYETSMTHADEAETSVGLFLYPEMVNMDYAVDTELMTLLPGGHFDTGVDAWRRPSKWSEGEGHNAMELYATPEGCVGHATKATAQKGKRPVLAICKYISMLIDEYLEAYPPGTVQKPEEVTMRTSEEMEAYLKEPLSEGWRPVYGLNKKVY